MRSPQNFCPIAASLDLVGDRWTLVLVRDMLAGKTRFGEFLASPERIASNVLADRLERMEQAGLVRKRPYLPRPERYDYKLTEKGAALLPVLAALVRWGECLGTARKAPAQFAPAGA